MTTDLQTKIDSVAKDAVKQQINPQQLMHVIVQRMQAEHRRLTITAEGIVRATSPRTT